MVYAKGKVFFCDTEDDLADLPTDRTPGCVAKVIETSGIYILNSSGEWILQEVKFQDTFINSVRLDEREHLIFTFNTSYHEPIDVDLGSINQPEIFLLQQEVDKMKMNEVSEDFINELFEPKKEEEEE